MCNLKASNFYFIGGLFPSSLENNIYVNSKSMIQTAANNLQWAIINGLKELGVSPVIITLPFLGTYPRSYSKIYCKGEVTTLNGFICYVCGFFTIPLFGLITRFCSLFKLLLCKVTKWEDSILIVYSIHTPFLLSTLLLKMMRPNLRLCLIIPDLPQFMLGPQSMLYLFLKKIDLLIINYCVPKFDYFVCVSQLIPVALNIEKKNWICIEGIFEPKTSPLLSNEKEKSFVFLYAGGLDTRYGLKNLLMAFTDIEEPDIKLWICGKGNAEKMVEDYCLRDHRISYFGLLKRNEVLILQQKATVLINPRLPNDDYTMYSFPSKTMEYLASGTPCIMHKLPSIPDEYSQYIYFAEDGLDGLKNKMKEVVKKPRNTLSSFGQKSRDFILSEKNPRKQVSKMINMLIK